MPSNAESTCRSLSLVTARRSRMVPRPRLRAQRKNEYDARDEAADMRPMGDSALLAPSHQAALEQLQDEPEAEHEQGRQPHDLGEEAERHEHQHMRARKQHQIGAEDAGD